MLFKSFIIFLTLTIYSCGNSETKKTELTYENGDQKIEVQILTGNDYLEYDIPTKTNFILTNIDFRNFYVIGVGIRVLENQNGIMKTEIKVPSNYLESDTLNVKVNFGEKSKERIEFNIPVKTAE
jgi:hypothetical protein